MYFLKKLKEKHQTEQQQKQAFHAVSIFYEIENIDQDRIGALKNKKQDIATKKTTREQLGSRLESSIMFLLPGSRGSNSRETILVKRRDPGRARFRA